MNERDKIRNFKAELAVLMAKYDIEIHTEVMYSGGTFSCDDGVEILIYSGDKYEIIENSIEIDQLNND